MGYTTSEALVRYLASCLHEQIPECVAAAVAWTNYWAAILRKFLQILQFI